MSTKISKALLDDVLSYAIIEACVAIEKYNDGSPLSALAHAGDVCAAMRALLAVNIERFSTSYSQVSTVSEQSFTDTVRFIRDVFEDAESDIDCLSEILRLGEIMGVSPELTYTPSVARLKLQLRDLSLDLER